jgi:8-oxo-dGTP pyrophosphatase MutT (NUDIX family)
MTAERLDRPGSAQSGAEGRDLFGPDGRRILDRRAARVLVIDQDGRLLLVHGGDPAEPEVHYWFTVGGGLDGGESARAAAVREVHEETGLVVVESDLVGPIWTEETEFGFGEWWLRQSQQYFVVRVAAWDPQPAALEEIERATIIGLAWWTVPQLQAQRDGVANDGPGEPGEKVYPGAIADLMENLAR